MKTPSSFPVFLLVPPVIYCSFSLYLSVHLSLSRPLALSSPPRIIPILRTCIGVCIDNPRQVTIGSSAVAVIVPPPPLLSPPPFPPPPLRHRRPRREILPVRSAVFTHRLRLGIALPVPPRQHPLGPTRHDVSRPSYFSGYLRCALCQPLRYPLFIPISILILLFWSNSQSPV